GIGDDEGSALVELAEGFGFLLQGLHLSTGSFIIPRFRRISAPGRSPGGRGGFARCIQGDIESKWGSA
ncbi:MAG: hypothetical protein ABUL54_09625, partial [Dongia sp.]